MKALVLIGGFGTRLRPITYTIPKQLIPIAGKPMLLHVLDLLPSDTEEVVLATGYKAEEIAAFLKANPPDRPTRCVAEIEPLGTGGGMRNAGEEMSDPFILLNSDVIADADVGRLVETHRARGGVGTMSLVEVEDTQPYGVAAVGENDRIERFVEKPAPAEAPSRWINAGVSVWAREVIDRIPDGTPVSFEKEILPGLIPKGIYAYRLTGYWEDAGTPERLLHAQQLLFRGGRGGPGNLPPGALGEGPVAFGSDSSAYGASFGPFVTLGSNVKIESGAHIQNSVLMDGVRVAAGASVSDSILGPSVRVEPGARLQGSVLADGERS